MIKKSSLFAIILMLGAVFASAQTQPATDVVMVLPFENKSGNPELNWIGESFADALSDLLTNSRFRVISNQERKVIQLRNGIPLNSLPSRAASLRMANRSNVNLLISGGYRINSPSSGGVATLTVFATMIRVQDGKFAIEEFKDGPRILPPFEITDAVANLQSMQGQIAYKIVNFHEKEVTFLSSKGFVEAASKVPPKAFEAYTKGLLTSSIEARENYFKNAARIYSESTGGVYADAEIELGHLYIGSRKGNEALSAFERIISQNQKCKDRAIEERKQVRCQEGVFAEAAFYLGLLYLQQGKYESAIATLRLLTNDLKLTTTYNALGAIAVQASRAEKKDLAKSAALLKDGLDYLASGVDSSPNDASLVFNFALALFLKGDYLNSALHLRNAIVMKPNDGEAYFVLAKALEMLKDPMAAETDSTARTLLTEGNRYATYAVEWEKAKTLPAISLRVIQPKRQDFVEIILANYSAPTGPRASDADLLLAQARTLIKEGKDEESMGVLRRVILSEPMSSEAYLLTGKVWLRQGDKDRAIHFFKTSIFWDNRLVEAHIALGKIYVEKGDCLQAKTYSVSAADISSDNEEVRALERLVERCSR